MRALRSLPAGLLLIASLGALPALTEVRLAGMAGVGAGLPLGNSFVLNPATVDLQHRVAFGTELGFAEGVSSDIQDFQGRLWLVRRVPVPRDSGLPDVGAGLSLDYAVANYSGSYPGAQGALWSEGRLDGAVRVKFGPLSVGLGMLGVLSGTGMAVNAETIAPAFAGDLNAGVFLGLANIGPGHLGVGVAVDRILADATNSASRQIMVGASYQIPRVIFAFDLRAAPDAVSPIDLALGADVSILPDRLSLRAGVQWLGLETIEPTVGVSLRIGALELAYAVGYNPTQAGIGTHRLGVTLAAR
ncbi:MAG: hypothetical protein J0L75_16325 [Spirochaetes bacterium]|nr:hypothetical protein [Spirochaetota bacterium]